MMNAKEALISFNKSKSKTKGVLESLNDAITFASKFSTRIYFPLKDFDIYEEVYINVVISLMLRGFTVKERINKYTHRHEMVYIDWADQHRPDS